MRKSARGSRESEREARVSWRLQAHRGGRQPGRRWRTAARAADRQLPACSGRRKQVAGTGQHSAGPASGLPGGLRQVSGQVVSFLSVFYFNYCFLFLFCFVLV